MSTDDTTNNHAEQIDLGNGTFMDNALRQSGWDWLTNYFGMPPSEIVKTWPEQATFADVAPLLVALVLQVNPGMTESQAWYAVRTANIQKLSEQMDGRSMGLDSFGRHVPPV